MQLHCAVNENLENNLKLNTCYLLQQAVACLVHMDGYDASVSDSFSHIVSPKIDLVVGQFCRAVFGFSFVIQSKPQLHNHGLRTHVCK